MTVTHRPLDGPTVRPIPPLGKGLDGGRSRYGRSTVQLAHVVKAWHKPATATLPAITERDFMRQVLDLAGIYGLRGPLGL